tara:strand:- start:42 stop:530 length:489 start_codon:yes stop_codon:yes gene_type:complete
MTTAEHKAIDQAHDEAKLQRQATAALEAISVLNKRADSLITKGDEEIQKFRADLQGDVSATSAMQWADGVMSATAARDVAKHIKKQIKSIPNETNIWLLRDSVNDRVIGSAKYPEFSTSPTRNLMSQFMASAFAEWASLLNQTVEHLEANGLKRPKSTTDEA